MYKVLIAEDEIIVREWLKCRIDWQQYGLVVCGEAANGQEALTVYEREKPDIILTDIRMPVMDGLSLLRKIREQDRRTRFLILTCLDEFALVKQAIDLDVTSYVLKLTSEPDEIVRELVKAKTYLDENTQALKPVSEEKKDSLMLLGMDPAAEHNHRFMAAVKYLLLHYKENISLLQVADGVGVTPNYLGKLFLKYCDSTFTDVLNRLRVQEAKALLDDPACRVYEVAEKTGFYNTPYFFRIFKKYEGCTPTEYRIGKVKDGEEK